jgi:hypothetical protein
VHPLLPAGAGNAVLITRRSRLAGLAGAEVVDLDVQSRQPAVELPGKIAGADRVAREPAAAEVLAALCGYLPLAVRIAGARLATEPQWRLQRLADPLGEQHRRLDVLTAGDLEVRAGTGCHRRVGGRSTRRIGYPQVHDVEHPSLDNPPRFIIPSSRYHTNTGQGSGGDLGPCRVLPPTTNWSEQQPPRPHRPRVQETRVGVTAVYTIDHTECKRELIPDAFTYHEELIERSRQLRAAPQELCARARALCAHTAPGNPPRSPHLFPGHSISTPLEEVAL